MLEQAKSFFTSEDFTFAELNDRALLQLQHATLNTLLFVALSFPMDIADERLQQVIADVSELDLRAMSRRLTHGCSGL